MGVRNAGHCGSAATTAWTNDKCGDVGSGQIESSCESCSFFFLSNLFGSFVIESIGKSSNKYTPKEHDWCPAQFTTRK